MNLPPVIQELRADAANFLSAFQQARDAVLGLSNVTGANASAFQSLATTMQAVENTNRNLARSIQTTAGVSAGVARQLVRDLRAAQEEANKLAQQAGSFAKFSGGFLAGALPGGLGPIAGALATGGSVAGLLGGALGGVVTSVISGAFSMAVNAARMAVNGLYSAVQSVVGVTIDLAKDAVEVGVNFERTRTSFQVLLGDMGKGRELFSSIQALSLKSPYSTEQLSATGKMLLGAGVAGEQVIPILSRLGEISGGDADTLRKLTKAYEDVIAKQRLQGEEVRQFANLGVGIKDFARAMGVETSEMLRRMKEGSVGADVVTQAINNLTDAGGRFAGMNERILGTVSGQWNRLKGVVEQLKGSIAERAFGEFGVAGKMKSATDFIRDSWAGASDSIMTALRLVKAVAEEVWDAVRAGWVTVLQSFASLGAGLDLSQVTAKFKDLARSIIDIFVDVAETVANIFLKVVSFGAPILGRLVDKLGDYLGTPKYVPSPTGEKEFFVAGPGGMPVELTKQVKAPDEFTKLRDVLVELGKAAGEARQGTAGLFGEWRQQIQFNRNFAGGGFNLPKGTPSDATTGFIKDVMGGGFGEFGVGGVARIQGIKQVAADAAKFVQDEMQALKKHGEDPLSGFQQHMKWIEEARRPASGAEPLIKDKAMEDQLIFKTFRELEQKTKIGEFKFPVTAVAGSQQAQDVANRSLVEARAPQEKMVEIMGTALDVQTQTAEYTKTVADFFAGLPKDSVFLKIVKRGVD